MRWLNLLSLDVVLIALAWQELFVRTAVVSLQWEERALLALPVWMIYIIDHWLDATMPLSCRNGSLFQRAPRHSYVGSHPLLLGMLLLLASLAILWLLQQLSPRLLLAGIVVALLTFCYLGINTLLLQHGSWLKGREIVIATIFAVGAALVALVKTDQPWMLLPSIVGFGVVAFINCTTIARLERGSILPFPSSLLRILIGGLFLFSLFSFFCSPMVTALCWSVTGLAIIPIIEQRFGGEIASLAADQILFFAALFTLLR